MTAWEKAHGMIDDLPEDSVNAVIQFISRLAPPKKKKLTPKMEAFLRLQELREKVPLEICMDEFDDIIRFSG